MLNWTFGSDRDLHSTFKIKHSTLVSLLPESENTTPPALGFQPLV